MSVILKMKGSNTVLEWRKGLAVCITVVYRGKLKERIEFKKGIQW